MPLSNTREVQAMQLPIQKLRPFENHPFQVKDDDEMNQLVWSVLTQGVLTPLVVRPLENDEYEVISGHRRLHACQKAGIETVPALIYALDRDAAAIALVDSNLHRENILPSEKAFAYKLKMDALSHQGTSGQVGQKWSRDAISDADSGRQVQRYIRLAHLIPALLDMVDDGRIAFSVGVELSFLDSDLQAALMTAIDLNDCTPSYAQACRMHKAVNNGYISEEMIDKIMAEEKPNQKEKVSISADELRGYVPNGTPSEMKAFIRKACEHYSDYLRRKERNSDEAR